MTQASSPGTRGSLKSLLPYLWGFRGRVALALCCLFIAKLANVACRWC